MQRVKQLKTSIFIVFLYILTGCMAPIAPDVKPKPATFDHPDEVRRGKGFMVLADRRVFATMAFLNAVGYDEEQPGREMHPVRIMVRRRVAENLMNDPKKLQAWRKYYQTHQFGMFYYKSFALSLSTDYPFARIVPNDQLGYPSTVVKLRDFPDILNDFWTTAHIDQVWDEVKGDYLEEIRRYDLDKMNRQMDFLWDYLRMERKDVFTIVQVPDLLDHHLGAMGAGYEIYYYSVDNPGSHEYALNAHEYLHTIVNPLAERLYADCKTKLEAYYQVAKDARAVQSYRQPVTFVFECLVRALDRRISVRFEDNSRVTRISERQVAHDTEEGLNLTQPFYDLLTEYEYSDMSFEEYLPAMLEKLPEYTKAQQ